MKKFNHTALWSTLRDSAPTIDDTLTESVLDGFRRELVDYCRDEKDLAERMRTLRFARTDMTTTLKRGERHGAEKKCGPSFPRRGCDRTDRLRTRHHRNGLDASGADILH